ncbi:MAG TPA: GAF domain-containing protein, partial [Chloroflexota bacterium]
MDRLDGVTELLRRPRSAADARLQAERLQLQIDALNDLAGAIRFGERLENVLPGVAEKAASLVGAEDALISIVEPDGALRLAIPNADDEDERIVFADDSHATRVARLGHPVIVNDLSQAGLSDSDLALAREHGITGFIAVPLSAGDRLIGLLHVTQRADRRPYVEDDLELLSTFARQAAIAIENARLYAESRQSATRLQLLVEAATETASSLEIDEILHRVCERARDLADADTAAISLLDETGTRLLTATLAGYAPEMEVGVRQLGPIPLARDALAREAFARGAAVHAFDYQHDSRTLAHEHPDVRTDKSITAVPLLFRGARIGMLFVGWTERSHRLTSREGELLETLARQASVAIENARLFGAISRRTEQFRALVDLSVKAASETDAQAVIQATTEAAAKLLSADRASLRIYDERQDLLVPRWKVGYAPVVRSHHLIRRPGRGTAGRAFAERRPVIENRYNDPEVADGRPEHIGLQSSLSVPLMARGRAIGVLNVGSMRARQFDAEDSELLQLFANQAALAIENARLLQSETDQARRLEVLYDNAKMLTMSLELGEVLDAMIEAAARITQATYCACYLVDEEQGDLCYAAGRGARPEVFRGLRLEIGEGLVGVSVAEDRPLLVPDIRLDARAARSDLDEAEGLRAVIYAPLRHRGRVIGALAAGRPEPNSFSDEHLRLLSAFADHAASAIANARLHDRTEEDLRHLNSLRAVVESISSELDLTSLLDKVVVRAVELLDAHGGTVSLVNPQTGLGRLKSVYGLSHEFVDFEMPAGTGLVGRVLEQRGPVVVDRYTELPQPLIHRSLADLKAGVAVPIWRQEALVGVFAIFSRDPERRFTEADVETLSTFAKHAAIAIENARLYEQSQQAAV